MPTTAEVRSSDRRQRVLDAASTVFRRHGYARTSMDAIAKEAGLSRPLLYLVFRSKEEAFAAAVEQMGDVALAELRRGLQGQQGVAARLSYVCLRWAARGYERHKENPDARDLIDPALPPVQRVYERFEELLAEIMTDGRAELARSSQVLDRAHMLCLALQGFKGGARSERDLERLIKLQIELVAGAPFAASKATERARARS